MSAVLFFSIRRAGRINHARERVRERYRVPLSRPDYDALVEQIVSGRAAELQRRCHTVAVFAVRYRNLSMFALYNSTEHCITTFLPPAWGG